MFSRVRKPRHVSFHGNAYAISPFLTHGCCVATFVSFCNHSRIPISLTFSRQPDCFACYVKTGGHVIKLTSNIKPTRSVCVYASNTLPFITISKHHLDHYFSSLQSLFESISINYKKTGALYS